MYRDKLPLYKIIAVLITVYFFKTIFFSPDLFFLQREDKYIFSFVEAQEVEADPVEDNSRGIKLKAEESGERSLPPLKIAFVWEFHQPFLKVPEGDFHMLPAFKQAVLNDYLYFLDLFNKFPDLKSNIAVSPSLLLNMIEASDGGYMDLLTFVMQSDDPDPLEKEIIKNEVRKITPRMVDKFPSYEDLAQRFLKGDELTDNEYIDLRVYILMYWFNNTLIEKDSHLKELKDRGKGYSQECLELLLEKERELLGGMFNKFTDIISDKQVELLSSPLYSPILPLLFEQGLHKDANQQITMGEEIYRDLLMMTPKGFWPPGGAVSQELLDYLVDEDLFWLVTDMSVLQKAGINVVVPENLYYPYMVSSEKGNTAVFFRDTDLSNRIRYSYQNMSAEAAVNDFIGKLHQLQKTNIDGDMIVTIALESGTFWRYYEDNGRRFRELLLKKINQDKRIETVTLTDYLRENGVKRELDELPAGSNAGDFSLWYGSSAEETAWDQLTSLLDLTTDSPVKPESRGELEDFIYRAQAGEWFEVYGQKDEFDNFLYDRLYRSLLLNAYERLDRNVKTDPDENFHQLLFATPFQIEEDLSFSIYSPVIDGINSYDREWRSDFRIKDVGIDMVCDQEFLYLRFDERYSCFSFESGFVLYFSNEKDIDWNLYPPEAQKDGKTLSTSLKISRDLGFPLNYRIHFPSFSLLLPEPDKKPGADNNGENFKSGKRPAEINIYRADGGGSWIETEYKARAGAVNFLEAAVPLKIFDNSSFSMRMIIFKGDSSFFYPVDKIFKLNLPDKISDL